MRNLLIGVLLLAAFGGGFLLGRNRQAAEDAAKLAEAQRTLVERERIRPTEPAIATIPPTPPAAPPSAPAPEPAPAPAAAPAAAPPLAEPKPAEEKAAPAGADEAIAALKDLSKKGLNAFVELGSSGLVEKFRALGRDGISILGEMMHDSSSLTRFFAAAILEGLHDPASIPALEGATRDPDLLVRRMASHALAVLSSTDAIPALEAAMQGDDDFGVRANSAYGLAKLGQKSGVDALLALWSSPDLDAGSRVAVLGGIVDAGNPEFAPIFRPLIGDKTKEYTYRLLGIMGAAKAKDSGSLEALAAVIGDASDQDSLREAAKKAVNAIKGEAVYKLGD